MNSNMIKIKVLTIRKIIYKNKISLMGKNLIIIIAIIFKTQLIVLFKNKFMIKIKTIK